MTNALKEVAKAERLLKQAVSKIDWKKHGFRAISTGKKSGDIQLVGPVNVFMQFDVRIQSYTPR